MLSGIRTGKRKRKAPSSGGGDQGDVASSRKEHVSSSSNMSAAEQLRQQLASGNKPPPSTSKSTELAVDRLQQRGRILKAAKKDDKDEEKDTVVLTGSAQATDRPAYRTEDFRYGSRKGKLKREEMDAAGTTKSQADMTIQDMVAEERNNKMTMDETYARNVARVGSRYKGTDFKQSSATGADEDEPVDMKMFGSQRLTTVASQQKERARQFAQHDKERSITSKSWWWMESSSFQKHMLISLGNHVSLVMTPSQQSLVKGHCYLVPIKHAESFVACEDDVWNEVAMFQKSLRTMFAKEGKGVLFCETVMPSSKGLWQTRMDVIPVTKMASQDAPMFFKSALTEQVEEWGTHTKLLSTKGRGLRRSVPNNFPYFYVEWEPGAGFAQIIETSAFPKDFGVDTIASMMELDPIRFQRKKKRPFDHDRQSVLDFLSKWKDFDWTLDLDG